MKNLKTDCLLFILILLLAYSNVSSIDVPGGIDTRAMSPLITQDHGVSIILQQAEFAIEKLKRDAEKREELVERSTDEDLHKYRIAIDDKIKQLQSEADKKAGDLEDKRRLEIKRLRYELDRRQLEIKNQAQDQALRLVQEKNSQEFIEKHGGSLNPGEIRNPKIENQSFIVSSGLGMSLYALTPELRKAMRTSFAGDIQYMKNIVLQAESPAEAMDFARRFNEQNRWFESMLASIGHQGDNRFKELERKKKNLSMLVSLQKRAEKVVEGLIKMLKLDSKKRSKISLLILYDLNDLYQKKFDLFGGEVSLITVSNHELNALVKNAVRELQFATSHQMDLISAMKATYTDPLLANNQFLKELRQLKQRLQETQDDLRLERDDSRSMKRDMKQKLHEKAVEWLNLEVELKQQRMKLKIAESELRKALGFIQKGMSDKKEVVQQLEKRERKNLALKLMISNQKEHLDHFQERAEHETQRVLDTMKKKYLNELSQEESRRKEIEHKLESALEQAGKFKKKSVRLEREIISLRERIEDNVGRVDQSQRQYAEAQRFAQEQRRLKIEAQRHAQLVDQLTENTVSSINAYLEKQYKELQLAKELGYEGNNDQVSVGIGHKVAMTRTLHEPMQKLV